jgi:hypothetical protein
MGLIENVLLVRQWILLLSVLGNYSRILREGKTDEQVVGLVCYILYQFPWSILELQLWNEKRNTI